MKFKIYYVIAFLIFSLILGNHSYAFNIVGKAVKCDASKFPTRGYPFFFYFEKENKYNSYYILENEIKSHNFDYRQVNADIYDLSRIGFFNKTKLILTHSKYNTKCICILLGTKKEIKIQLKSFIDNKN